MEKFKCCLCGKDHLGWGNNPYPLVADDDYDSRCCDDCNSKYVLMARITGIRDIKKLKVLLGERK